MKRSSIWHLPAAELQARVAQSESFSEVLRGFGLKHQGGNARTLKRRLDADGVDYSHIRQGRDSNKGRRFAASRVPLENVLVEGATYSRFHLKRRLLQEGVLANMCGVCGCARLKPRPSGRAK